MATSSRFIKTLNYPPPTPEEMRHSASRLINSRIKGNRSGAEAREIARTHTDPVLREAARIMDEHDAAVARPMGVEEANAQRSERQAGLVSDSHPSDRDQVGPALAPRRPLMQPSRDRQADGKFGSYRETAKWRKVGDAIRQARAENDSKDGAA